MLRPVRKPIDKNLFKVQLAAPWHYRRAGVYYLRIRPVGSTATYTLSLRTSERSKAMPLSKQLQTTLRQFHLDNPDATWEQLRDHLRHLAEGILATPTAWDEMDSMRYAYSDVQDDLYRIAVTSAMTHAQAQAVTLGRRIMLAAQERVLGDPRALVGLIDEMNGMSFVDRQGSTPVSLSVGAPRGATRGRSSGANSPVTFESLADRYMAEQEVNLRESTMREIRGSCSTLSQVLGKLDLRSHKREDLLSARAKLLEGRMPSTVNKITTRLSTVLQWAVNNGYLERAFDKKLKITKGAESRREAFTQAQVRKLMSYANSLPEDSWERWVMSIGAVTGARLNEICQLNTRDVRKVGETWVIDINTAGGRGLKNKHSVRLVPITDGAYGFEIETFLGFVNQRPADGKLFTVGAGYIGQCLSASIRKNLNTKSGGALTFHSLRHSLASLLKEHGVPLGTAQDILGHSAQSITYDLYGGGQKVAVEKLADALRALFSDQVNK